MAATLEQRGSPNMSSQEELADGLRQLTEALASYLSPRLTIVRDDDKPRTARPHAGQPGRKRKIVKGATPS
jgi:hypothetical protein